MSSSGKAKIEDVTEYFSHDLIDKVLEKFPRKNVEELDITNTLYNILIPKKIKNEIRNHPNIQWKMDLESAQYPWEMLHDTINDKEPIFVKSGMVRQLLSRASFPYERIVRSQKALVIGDPIYTHLKPLPFAEQEAEELKDKLEINDWEVDYISKGNLFQILARLQRQYKLLHIAGHGVYDPQTKQAGIVVEDTVIDSHFFKSLPYIPEFAFINCCYSGDIDSTYEQKTKQKYKLAASLGIQLIEQGVEAVIITGWAVDDDAALAFADIFYEHLLSNKTFGQAALAARRQVYQDYGEYSVTWGAYQCYGNPHYKIQRRSSNNGFIDYEDEDHVLTLLFNLKSKCIRKSELSNIADQVAELFEKCRAKGLDTPLVLQNIAEIYFEIGELEQAKTIFEKMLKKENAKYSVRSLEQYCNLLFKIELENEKEPEEEYIKKILKYFDYFLEVQTNAERYSLRASAFKRLSMIYPEDMDKYLAMMVTGYMEALDYADQPKVYPLVNHRQAAYFTDANYRNPKRSEYKDTRKLIHEVKSNIPPPSHNDFWADIEIVNLLTTDLIYTDDLSTVDQLKDEIMKIYKKRFARTGTYKHLKSEIEHFDFLDKVINHYSDNHSFQLETIKADAVAYILSELKSLDPKKNDL